MEACKALIDNKEFLAAIVALLWAGREALEAWVARTDRVQSSSVHELLKLSPKSTEDQK